MIFAVVVLGPLIAAPCAAQARTGALPAAQSTPAATTAPAVAPLTYAAAVQRALAANPRIVAARLRRSIDLASRDVAGERLNPEFRVEFARETPKEGYTVALPWELGGKRGRRVDVANATVRVGEAELDQAIAEVQAEVRRVYFARFVAENRQALHDEMRSLAERVRDAAQAKFEAGGVPRLDVLQAQLALAEAQNQAIAARGAVDATRTALNALLGFPIGAPTPIDMMLDVGPAITVDAAVARARQASVELVVADRRIDEQRARVALAHALRAPDLTPEASLTRRAEPEFDTGWRAALAITLPVFTTHRAGVQVEDAALAQLMGERVASEVRVTAEAASAAAIAEAQREQYRPLPRRDRAPGPRGGAHGGGLVPPRPDGHRRLPAGGAGLARPAVAGDPVGRGFPECARRPRTGHRRPAHSASMTPYFDRLVFAFPICLALALTGCSKEAPEDVESETVVPVTVARAERGSITAVVHATGVVAPAPGAELIVVAPAPGRILEMRKAEGDAVRRGDVLVRFEIPSAAAEATRQRAEIARATARLENAHAAQKRARDLFERGVAAHKEVEDAAREVADAEADLAGARAEASAADTVAARSVVRATFDGIVARRSHNPGDLVEAAASDEVLRVVDPHRLEVIASVPVADALRVKIGEAARLVDAPEGTPLLKVIAHPGSVQQGTASVPVRLAFTRATEFPVGAPVQVQIDAESRSSVVLVPISAIVHEGDEAAVFVASGDKAHRRAVTTGLAEDRRVEIRSGVEPGELVITSGQNGLPDGAKVALTRAPGDPGEDDAPTERAGGKPDADKK